MKFPWQLFVSRFQQRLFTPSFVINIYFQPCFDRKFLINYHFLLVNQSSFNIQIYFHFRYTTLLRRVIFVDKKKKKKNKKKVKKKKE